MENERVSPGANARQPEEDFVPSLVPLDRPRPLTELERGLIDFLLEPPYGDEALRAQARTANVIGVCTCGCPSVLLGVDTSAPASDDGEWTPSGPHDLTAYQVKSRGLGAQVTLHVSQGHLVELEIWAGGYGIRPRLDLARLVRVQGIPRGDC
jgi:hypothetical protein